MSAETLVQALLGARRASQYIFSLSSGEFEQYLESHTIPSFIASGDSSDVYLNAAVGLHPIIYLEHGVSFESDVPEKDVLFCLDLVRRNALPSPKVLVAFADERQCRALRRSIRMMCIARAEPSKVLLTPNFTRFVYDCRAGERWVEIYFAKEPIPTSSQMSV